MLTQHTEHVQQLLSQNQETTNTCMQHYKAILRQIYDNVPIIPQVRKSIKDSSISGTITSNFLCLQCPIIMSHDDIAKHGDKKSHRFCGFMMPSFVVADIGLTCSTSRRLQDRLTVLPHV